MVKSSIPFNALSPLLQIFFNFFFSFSFFLFASLSLFPFSTGKCATLLLRKDSHPDLCSIIPIVFDWNQVEPRFLM